MFSNNNMLPFLPPVLSAIVVIWFTSTCSKYIATIFALDNQL